MPTGSSTPLVPDADRARHRDDWRQGRRDLARRRRGPCNRQRVVSVDDALPRMCLEQDPEEWWRAAQACLARLPEGEIGLAGQMHGLVVLDGDGRVLRPAILWNDQRTLAQCAEIEARVGLDRLIAITGNRALTGFTAPKLLWLREFEPEIYARIRHVLLPKDYVRFRLTGQRATDAADASGTLLFDVAGRCWSEDALRGARDSGSNGCRRCSRVARWEGLATRRRLRSE